jgi:hypothetical protein
MTDSAEKLWSLNQLFSALYAGKKEAMRHGSDAGYGELISSIDAWCEERHRHRIPVDPDEKKSNRYWYGLFDQLSFFIRSTDEPPNS